MRHKYIICTQPQVYNMYTATPVESNGYLYHTKLPTSDYMYIVMSDLIQSHVHCMVCLRKFCQSNSLSLQTLSQ